MVKMKLSSESRPFSTVNARVKRLRSVRHLSRSTSESNASDSRHPYKHAHSVLGSGLKGY